MSKVINYYVLIHYHKHGASSYVFKSTEIYSTISKNIKAKLAKKLKIDYEPDKLESLELEIIEHIPNIKL